MHVVFSTKHREPLIDPEIEAELHPYLATVCRSMDCPTLDINGVADHVHLLVKMGRRVSIADLVEKIKTSSSRWIKSKGPRYRAFYWQNGYGAFSIGQSAVADLRRYIGNQKEHHRDKSFQDEYRLLLTKYEIEFDERYVWD